MNKQTNKNLIYNLSEALSDKFLILDYGIATGCLCMSCHSYQFKDLDGKIVLESENLFDLLEKVKDYKDE